MVANLRQKNTLQFQYFWDFNKCFQEIFSQLGFGNFWLYFLGKVDMSYDSKIIKIDLKTF